MAALDLDPVDTEELVPRRISRDAVALQAWRDAQAKRAADTERMAMDRQQSQDAHAQNALQLEGAQDKRLAQTMANDATQWASNPRYAGKPLNDFPEAKSYMLDAYGRIASQVPETWNQAQRNVTGDPNFGRLAMPDPKEGETIERDANGGISTRKVYTAPQSVIDPNATGEDVLKSLKPQEAATVRQLANYSINYNTLNRFKPEDKSRILQALEKVDPTWSADEYPARQALKISFKSGQGAASRKAANTVVSHLGELMQHAKELDGFGGWGTLLNKARNPLLDATGSSKVQAVESSADAVASELAKLYKGTGSATDQEIQAWRNKFRPDMSPDQMRDQVRNGVKLMGGALNALQTQYEQGLKKPKDSHWLEPEARKILNDIGGINVDAIDPVSDPLSENAPGATEPITQEQEKFTVGEVYYDGQGRAATYVGDGKWKR